MTSIIDSSMRDCCLVVLIAVSNCPSSSRLLLISLILSPQYRRCLFLSFPSLSKYPDHVYPLVPATKCVLQHKQFRTCQTAFSRSNSASSQEIELHRLRRCATYHFDRNMAGHARGPMPRVLFSCSSGHARRTWQFSPLLVLSVLLPLSLRLGGIMR